MPYLYNAVEQVSVIFIRTLVWNVHLLNTLCQYFHVIQGDLTEITCLHPQKIPRQSAWRHGPMLEWQTSLVRIGMG